MESTMSSFMRIDTPSHGPSPSSNRAGLPPRPNSAKLKSSVRNLLPKGSFRAKYLSQCGEETVDGASPKNGASPNSAKLICVMPATPHPATIDGASPKNAPDTEIANEDAGEDIPEEEAVCRICLVELREGGETLKMQCSCRGELALAHQDCAVKWFTIKRNKTCDVCKQDVKNLPVIFLKTPHALIPFKSRIWIPIK